MSKPTGSEMIAAECQRQHWSAAYDDEYANGGLAMAAACYAAPRRLYERRGDDTFVFEDPWPWEAECDKRPVNRHGYIRDNNTIPVKMRISQLVKAGALIAAEIDRLQRLGAKP